MSRKPLYFSLDIETDGQSPGLSSMLQLGCAAFEPGNPHEIATFQANLYPLLDAQPDPETMRWWGDYPDAWAALTTDRVEPDVAMGSFREWVLSTAPPVRRPIAACWPAAWDYGWVYYYFQRFGVKSPFGHSALDIKTLALAHFKRPGKSVIPVEWKMGAKHTHCAVDDAIEQGRILVRLLQELGIE